MAQTFRERFVFRSCVKAARLADIPTVHEKLHTVVKEGDTPEHCNTAVHASVVKSINLPLSKGLPLDWRAQWVFGGCKNRAKRGWGERGGAWAVVSHQAGDFIPVILQLGRLRQSCFGKFTVLQCGRRICLPLTRCASVECEMRMFTLRGHF